MIYRTNHMEKIVDYYPRYMIEGMSAPDNSVLISIRDQYQEEAMVDLNWNAILRLTFDDADKNGDLFDNDQAKEVVTFLEIHSDKNIYVHCHYGVSRSAAVALFIAEDQGRLLFCKGIKQYNDPPQFNRHVYRTLHQVRWGVMYKSDFSVP